MTINPYLTFEGNCEEAFNFYKSVFGGEFPYVGKFKDMPSEHEIPASAKEKIMHISLPISKETTLMGSDTSEAFGVKLKQGNNFSISINVDNAEEAKTTFSKLAQDGTVTVPLEKTFWAPLFGMLIDKFGIQWMISYNDDK
ncbi:VOC family protein [Mesonia aquimarina]|uniref:VOC family protein n=1 Tax=Mesonia aquimarina TaxID=1504967 RepID=UPI000EF59D65|nr:VOC family protein [Mesonia aquimarina]